MLVHFKEQIYNRDLMKGRRRVTNEWGHSQLKFGPDDWRVAKNTFVVDFCNIGLNDC